MLLELSAPNADIQHREASVIQVTRLDRVRIILNSDLIEHMEVTPDTVISLTTGQKIRVLESTQEIVDRIVDFRRSYTAFPGPSLEPQMDVGARSTGRPGKANGLC